VNVVYAIEQRTELWREVRRILKSGGRAVIATSVSTDSKPIIREHLAHASIWPLLRPKLIAVFLVDAMINQFGRKGAFEFPDQSVVLAELAAEGGKAHNIVRCYGGEAEGVDILFTATF
jgi:ubiquinone/menaquinone biosynthesis C-methylase UbiE